jgi:hypothetical protein
MKHRLLLVFACAMVSVSGWALWVSACDDSKQTSTRSASATKAAVAKNGSCAMHGATAAACRHPRTSATTASMSGCAHDGAKGASAVTAGYVSFSGASHSCGMKGARNSATTAGMDCDACSDMASCQEELRSSNAQMQVVPLKNGVMYVYTAGPAADVRSVQAALARRTARLTQIASAGDQVKLCPECKAVRGAIASGKLSRETVNIDGGCLTLMTSHDAALVAKLHGMAGVSSPHRSKS